jgi:hypothetical protein
MRMSSCDERALTTETPTPCRDAFFFVYAGGDATTVIGYRARAVGVQDDVDAVTMTGERFIDRIVDDFVDHVMEPRTVVGIAYIHPRAFPDSVKPAQHLNRGGAVSVFGSAIFSVVSHSVFL